MNGRNNSQITGSRAHRGDKSSEAAIQVDNEEQNKQQYEGDAAGYCHSNDVDKISSKYIEGGVIIGEKTVRSGAQDDEALSSLLLMLKSNTNDQEDQDSEIEDNAEEVKYILLLLFDCNSR